MINILQKIKIEIHSYSPGYLKPIITQIVQKAQYYGTISTIVPKQ